MTPTKEQIIEWTALVHEKQSVHGWDKEEIRQVLESDPDALNSAIEFASLVAAAAYTKGREDMRERCAKVCESMEYEFKAGHECAAAIRAIPIQKGGGT